MNLRDMIEEATKRHEDQKAMAKVIGVHPDVLTSAKAGRRGLPVAACYKLAAILGIDEKIVVAASELVTEKNPEKRAVFAPFVLDLPRKAATWLIASAAAATIGTAAPTNAEAASVDTFKVSSPAPQPAPLQGSQVYTFGIMSTIRGKLREIGRAVIGRLGALMPRFGCAG